MTITQPSVQHNTSGQRRTTTSTACPWWHRPIAHCLGIPMAVAFVLAPGRPGLAQLPPNRTSTTPAATASQGSVALMATANALFQKSDFQGAIATWTQVILAKPDTAILHQALINRSKAYLVISQPELAELWLLKGTAYLQNRQYSEAISALNQSQRLNPNNSILYSNRSSAYRSLGKIVESKADIEKAIQLQPTFSNYYNLAILYKLTGNFKGCYSILSQIIAKSQPFADLYVQRGQCADKLGKQDETIADMLKALKLDPSNVEAIQQMGLTLLAKKDKEAAKQYLIKASSLRLANGQIEDYKKILAVIGSIDQR